MFISKMEAWKKLNKTDITNIKKELIFYNLFEYELKTFLNTDKNTRLLKNLVSQLVNHNLTLESIKEVLIRYSDKKIYEGLIKIGCIDNNYILFIKPIDYLNKVG